MSEEMIIRNCSPTLAGLKTGNIFTCNIESKKVLMDEIRNLNITLRSKGLRIIPLRIKDNKAMIYIFRPARLKSDLSCTETNFLLSQLGYSCKEPENCVVRLINRIQESEVFPHEIGLFLGYPPEDVQGFIETKTPKFTGYWQVFGDEEKAKRLFAKYKKCTNDYMKQLINGKSLERLAIAV